eukprot:6464568-Amphidinium_carterae.2
MDIGTCEVGEVQFATIRMKHVGFTSVNKCHMLETSNKRQHVCRSQVMPMKVFSYFCPWFSETGPVSRSVSGFLAVMEIG